MSIEAAVFYLFAAILVGSAGAVVTVKNPVYAALLLVLAFFTSAAIWLLLEAEFLAITLVLVYVGAVMVLFLFVVMMLDVNLVPLREGFIRYLPVGIGVALVMFVEMVMVVGSVAAIALTMRRRPQTKYQDPAQQVLVKRNDRVRMVKMTAEKKTPVQE